MPDRLAAQLRQLGPADLAGESDAALLDRCAAGPDDADDAFQAAFLVLARKAEAVAAADPALAADLALLESVKGGRQTATTILAELPPVGELGSAESAAAYCGLAPAEFQSGKSVRKRTRLSKAGNARLRTALDLPTLTAVRFNPVLRGFFDRLVAAGKPRMQAVGACMRKLVMLCYGVLQNRAPFDPEWASRITR